MGALNHEEVMPLFSNARCFVQHSVVPSYGDAEGTPVAILEAQAAGLPAVATRHAGIVDAVVDGSDFGIWNANKFTATGKWSKGDFNADGSSDGSDFGIWNANKFTASDASQVPEPVTSGFASLAMLALCIRRKR